MMLIGKIRKSDLPEILLMTIGGLLGGLIIFWWRHNQLAPVIGAVVGFTNSLYQIRRRNKQKNIHKF